MANLQCLTVVYKRGIIFWRKEGGGERASRCRASASQGNNMTSNSMSPFLRVNRNQLAMMFWIINSKKRATAAHFRTPPISQIQSMSIILRLLQPNTFPYYKRQRKSIPHSLREKSKNLLNTPITKWRLNSDAKDKALFFFSFLTSWGGYFINFLIMLIA